MKSSQGDGESPLLSIITIEKLSSSMDVGDINALLYGTLPRVALNNGTALLQGE